MTSQKSFISSSYNYICAALMGVALFALAFGFLLLSPDWTSWLHSSLREQYQSAWLAYRNTAWSFPLGHLPNFFFPHGSSIAYMDGAPWYLTILKVFSSFLPEHFAAWGWWMLFCCILQAVSARLFMEKLSQRELVRWIGTLFLSFSPIMITRCTHFALLCQGLILLAWTLFFCREQGGIMRWLWIMLLILTAGIHPYLTVMVVSLRAGALIYSDLKLTERFFDAILSFAGVLAVFELFGYFQNGSTQDIGANYFSADLATFIISFGSSTIFPSLPSRAGEQEGFAYVGAGILFLLAVLIYRRFKFSTLTTEEHAEDEEWMRKRIRQGFIISSILLLYSFGPNLTLFGLDLPIQNPLFILIRGKLREFPMIFRAPGRFAWPFYYLLIAYSVRTVSSRMALLYVAVLIQIIDFGPDVVAKHERFSSSAKPPIFFDAVSNEWLKNADAIKFIPMEPRAICGLVPSEETSELLKWILPLAAQKNIPFNSGLQARAPIALLKPLCEEQIKEFKDKKFNRETTYVVDNQYMSEELYLPDSPIRCRRFDNLSICITK